MEFTFWGISGDAFPGSKQFQHLAYDGAEELAKEEFEKRKETLPLEEVLKEAEEIINPIYQLSNNVSIS